MISSARATLGQTGLALFAPTWGPLSTFTVAAVTTPLRGSIVAAVVLTVLIVLVSATAIAGGGAAATVAAAMASCSFDFFHVAPLGTLHVETLTETLALMNAVALVTMHSGLSASGARRRERPGSHGAAPVASGGNGVVTRGRDVHDAVSQEGC